MKNYNNQVNQYNEFNKELKNGIDQNLSLYNPSYDKTLYKNIDDIKKPEANPEAKEALSFLNNFHSPVMFGDLGSDIYNFFNKEKDEPFRSKTVEFYLEPAKEITKQINSNYTDEIYTILIYSIIGLIIYKKI